MKAVIYTTLILSLNLNVFGSSCRKVIYEIMSDSVNKQQSKKDLPEIELQEKTIEVDGISNNLLFPTDADKKAIETRSQLIKSAIEFSNDLADASENLTSPNGIYSYFESSSPDASSLKGYAITSADSHEIVNPNQMTNKTLKDGLERGETIEGSSGKLAGKNFYKKHPKYSQAIYYHEYGHSFLDHNLSEINPTFKSYRNTFFQLHDLGKKINALPKIDPLRKALVQKKNTISNIYSDQSLYLNSDHYKAVQELFADLYATMKFGNSPDIITNALSSTFQKNKEVTLTWVSAYKDNYLTDYIYRLKKKKSGTGRTEEIHMSRSFSNKQNHIDKWKPNSNYYALFAPTRFYLYKYFLKKPVNKSVKEQSRLLEAFVNVLNDIISSTEPDSLYFTALKDRGEKISHQIRVTSEEVINELLDKNLIGHEFAREYMEFTKNLRENYAPAQTKKLKSLNDKMSQRLKDEIIRGWNLDLIDRLESYLGPF